jgi:hypothetical protein
VNQVTLHLPAGTAMRPVARRLLKGWCGPDPEPYNPNKESLKCSIDDPDGLVNNLSLQAVGKTPVAAQS